MFLTTKTEGGVMT